MNWLTNKILEAESSIKNVIGSNSHNTIRTNPDEPFITAEMVEYVRNMCQHPKTFSEFPLEEKDKEGKQSFPLLLHTETFILLPWQENHAKIILDQVSELKTLRFKLCPSILAEERFWRVYFLLLTNKIREEASTEKPTTPSTPLGEGTKRFMNVLSPLTPLLGMMGNSLQSNTSTQVQFSPTSEIEDYYDNLMKESIDNSLNISFDGGL
jgi:hypothetical protein